MGESLFAMAALKIYDSPEYIFIMRISLSTPLGAKRS